MKVLNKNMIKISGLLSVLLLAPATVFAQAAAAPAQSGGGFGMFLPLIFIFVIFFFLIVRPQQKQAKQRQQMMQSVAKGDQIITVGGIHGKIVGVAENILTVEISDNCKIKMDRNGIQSVKKDAVAS